MEAAALIFLWTSSEHLSLNLDAWDFYSKLFTFIQVDGEPPFPFFERGRNFWRPELFPLIIYSQARKWRRLPAPVTIFVVDYRITTPCVIVLVLKLYVLLKLEVT